jgi:branched-chain amino acid transport system substrate-binding protein
MRNTKIFILFFTTLFVLLGCNGRKGKTQNQSADKIQIGCISVLSGDGANYGIAAKTAIDMAVNEINSQGGINGKKIEILYEDWIFHTS